MNGQLTKRQNSAVLVFGTAKESILQSSTLLLGLWSGRILSIQNQGKLQLALRHCLWRQFVARLFSIICESSLYQRLYRPTFMLKLCLQEITKNCVINMYLCHTTKIEVVIILSYDKFWSYYTIRLFHFKQSSGSITQLELMRIIVWP
jgi:hypothetical protein